MNMQPSYYGGRTFCRKTLHRKTLCRKTFCRGDILPNVTLSNEHFVERTVWRTDFSPKRHFAETIAENREILGVVTRTDYDWLLNKSSQSYNQFINLMTETLIVK